MGEKVAPFLAEYLVLTYTLERGLICQIDKHDLIGPIKNKTLLTRWYVWILYQKLWRLDVILHVKLYQ